MDSVFAAGGDGTVSAVIDGLAHTEVPLGIIPAGTTNVLAQELGIPLNVDKACQLLSGEPATRAIDALQFGNELYVLSVGTGISAMAIKGTSREGKRKFGPLAYVWSVLKVVVGAQPYTFTIVADGQTMRIRGADVLLANVSKLTGPINWGQHIKPDDGQIDICIMRARNFFDIIGVAFDILIPGRPRKQRYLIYRQAKHSVVVFANRPLAVQGDGEYLGQLTLEVYLVPGAVRVLVPQKKGNGRRMRLPLLSNSGK